LASPTWGDNPFGVISPPGPTSNAPIKSNNPRVASISDGSFQRALLALKDASDEDTITFYKKMGEEPVWFFQGNLSKCGQIAVEVLKDAAIEGLNPHDYEDAISFGNHPANWIDAEILLTKRYLEFINHVRTGRIDPTRISHDIKFKSPTTQPIELLMDVIQDKSTNCSKLHQMGPNTPQYIELKKILAHYREFANEIKDLPTINTTKPLKLGDTSPEVTTLRQILYLLGDLDEDDATSPKFDNDVDQALRQFQRRHTLEADGVVGGKTKDALNEPLDDRIRKVIINMERLRWLPNELGDKYIIVNVAGYEVQAYENNKLMLSIPAIVGRPSRRTPLFYATLKNVIVNPSWGVPYNILVHDKIPKIIDDPDYVHRSGFTVTDESGNVVDPDEADWENEGSHYHLRQSPGRHNALGRIKFNIENPYTVYMHGTPEEKLFQKTARPFSSGCIRLKTPVELAVWALNDESKWTSQTINAAINKGSTQTVKPEDSINVYFTYQTVWMGEDGLIHISDDPYRMDPKMEKVLNPET
jgi:murein L,D-transpeptidase YcbB/YkuD